MTLISVIIAGLWNVIYRLPSARVCVYFNLTRGRLPPTQFNYIDPRRRRRRTCGVFEEEGSQSFDLPAVLQPASQSQSQTREGEKGTNGEWRGKRSKRE